MADEEVLERQRLAEANETLQTQIDILEADFAMINELEEAQESVTFDEDYGVWVCVGYTDPSWRGAVLAWLQGRAAQKVRLEER